MEGALGRIDQQEFDLDRLRGFSDAVFSIAITVIVLQVAVPAPEVTGDAFREALGEQIGLFISYVVSFAVIGRYWLGHHRLFDLLERADTRLAWLNMVLLLVLVFMPFPTEVLGLYGDLEVAVVFYGIVATLLGVVNAALWIYATAGHRLVPDELPDRVLRLYRAQSSITPAVFVVFTAVGTFDPGLAYLAFVLFIPANWLVSLRLGRIDLAERQLEDELEERRDEARLREDLDDERKRLDADPSGPSAGAGGEGPRSKSSRANSTVGRLITGRSVSSLDRLVAFSDGVYAIAITLLGLEFKVPVDQFETNDELVDFLRGAPPTDVDELYFSYLLTFAVLGIYWMLHHRYFQVIVAQDEQLRTLNMFHLFFVTSVPFASEIIAGHDEEAVSVVIYALSAGMVGLSLSLLWLYSWRASLVPASVTPRAARTTLTLSLTMPAVFLVSIPIALVLGSKAQYLWLAGFVLVQVVRHVALGSSAPPGSPPAPAR